MKAIVAAAILFGHMNGATLEESKTFDFVQNGADWGSIAGAEDCNKPGGSPINVNTDMSLYKNYFASLDNFTSQYSNQKDTKVTWDGHTTKVYLDPANGLNQFTSDLGRDVFNAHTNQWDG